MMMASRSKAFFVGKNENRSLINLISSDSSLCALLGFCLTNKDALTPRQSETNSAQRLSLFAPDFSLVNPQTKEGVSKDE